MGLQLMGCRNVSVTGLNISSTGGDGIYVAGWGHHINLPNGSRLFVSTRQHSANITVRGVHCHDNYRQVTDPLPPPLLGRLQSEGAFCPLQLWRRLSVAFHPCIDRLQGMSIISVVGMRVSDSTFSGTNGTAPQFGIDMEPNRVLDSLQVTDHSLPSLLGRCSSSCVDGRTSTSATAPSSATSVAGS